MTQTVKKVAGRAAACSSEKPLGRGRHCGAGATHAGRIPDDLAQHREVRLDLRFRLAEREARADQRAAEIRLAADADAVIVEQGARAAARREEFLAQRVVNDTVRHTAFH